MAKKDAYYFSHDANAQDDPKCMILIDQMGMEGYGIYWALIEKLRNEKDYKLPISVIGSLAKRWSTSKEKVATVVKKYSLFELENDLFFSLRLVRSMNEKSEKARISASYRWPSNANALQSHTDRSADGMRNDAIKEKEKKESKVNKKEAIAFTPPSENQVFDYFKEKGYTEGAAKIAFEYYAAADWHDSKGAKVKNWKQKMLSVWFKPENKIQNGQQSTTTSYKQPNHGQSAGAIKLAHSLAADCNIDQQGRTGNTGNEIPFADIQ
jgi:hypothetical protein